MPSLSIEQESQLYSDAWELHCTIHDERTHYGATEQELADDISLLRSWTLAIQTFSQP